MNRNYKVIWNRSLGCFTAVAEYAKSRGKSSNTTVSSASSTSAAVSAGARLLRLSSLSVALAATGLMLSTQASAATGVTGGTGDGTAISVCDPTGTGPTGQANADTLNSIAIGCNATTGVQDFNLLDAGNPNNGDAAAAYNVGADNPGGVLYSNANNDAITGSTAVGSNAAATGSLSTAYGSQARATGGSTVALGVAAVATADGAIATGLQSAATGQFSQASGVVSSATGDASTAIGHSSLAEGYRSIAIGATDIANDPLGFGGYGYNASDATEATGDNAIAFGGGAKALGESTIAIGKDTQSVLEGATAVGRDANAAGFSTVAVGDNSTANQVGDVAIGINSIATGGGADNIGAVALGADSNALGNGNIAIGDNSNSTSGNRATAIGSNAATTGSRTTAIGFNSSAIGTAATALGDAARAEGRFAVAIRGQATAENAIALGGQATAENAMALDGAASAENAIALGGTASAANSVSIGQGSLANGTTLSTAAYQPLDANGNAISVALPTATAEVNIGSRRLTGLAAGANDTDAVNVSQLKAVDTKVNQGIKFSVDGGERTYALGETIGLTTDSNLITTPTTDGINVAVNPNLNLGPTGSVTTGNTVTNAAGITMNGNSEITILNGPVDTVTLGRTGLNNGGNTITNVADGLASDDVATFGQLTAVDDKVDVSGTSTAANLGGNAAYNAADGSVSAPTYILDDGNNAGTTANFNDVGSALGNLDGRTKDNTTAINQGIKFNVDGGERTYALGETIGLTTDSNLITTPTTDGINVAVNSNLDLGAAGVVTTGNTVTNNAGVTILNGTNQTVTLSGSGLNNGANTITNVADGLASDDAATFGQLTAVDDKVDVSGTSTAANLGGNAAYNAADGSVSAPTYILDDGNNAGTTANFNDVGSALGNLDGRTKDNTTAISQGIKFNVDGGERTYALGETIGLTTDSNLITTPTTDGINVAVNPDLVLDSVITGNTVTNNTGVRIDDGTNVTAVTLAGTNVTDGTNTSDYGAEGFTATDTAGNNGISVNKGGISFIDGGGAQTGPSVTAAGFNAGGTVITNVASGGDVTDPNNATNGVNAGDVNTAIEGVTAAGLNFVGDDGTVIDRDLGQTLSVTGSATGNLTTGNIGVVADGTDGLSVQLAEDIDLGADGSVTTGNTVTNNTGVTITDSTNTAIKTTITTAGTNVTDGTNTADYGLTGASLTDGVNTNNSPHLVTLLPVVLM